MMLMVLVKKIKRTMTMGTIVTVSMFLLLLVVMMQKKMKTANFNNLSELIEVLKYFIACTYKCSFLAPLAIHS